MRDCLPGCIPTRAPPHAAAGPAGERAASAPAAPGREPAAEPGLASRSLNAVGRISRVRIGAPEFVKFIYDKDGLDRHENDIARRRQNINVRQRLTRSGAATGRAAAAETGRPQCC